MYINREMANCLMDIKRALPPVMQNKFKLSSPDIDRIVYDTYHRTKDIKIKSLCIIFLENANPRWQLKFNEKTKSADTLGKKIMDANIFKNTWFKASTH